MSAGAPPAEPEASEPRGVDDGRALADAHALADALAGSGLRLERRLHAGRLTEIWRAADRNGTVVAVKTPVPSLAAHAGAHEWLRREHACLTRLEHASIVRALDFVERRGRCALVMEYLGGGDLVPLAGAAPRHWIGAAAALASALLHVHDRGYVHGDIKARNALFGDPRAGDARARSAKLADFGSALPIGASLPAKHGTAAHRPPVSGELGSAGPRFPLAEGSRRSIRAPSRADERAPSRAGPHDDAYAFAVLLYELLAGRLPYDPRSSAGAGERALPAPPLTEAGEPPALRALARLVMDVLTAPEAAGAATLTNFFDVIEWVRKGS